MRLGGMWFVVGSVGAIASLNAWQEPVFRSRSDAVLVSAVVRDKNRPVAGLTAADFQLRDNGVLQDLTSTDAEKLPVDVTLVMDTSGSLEGAPFAQLKTDVRRMAELVRVDDRLRLLTFGSSVTDPFGLQPGTANLALERLSAGGPTRFYDALGASLMVSPSADRPQLVVAVSDGLDTSSYLDPRRLASLARYSSATLYLVLVPNVPDSAVSTTGRLTAGPQLAVVPHRRALEEAISLTGGIVYVDETNESLPKFFRRVLDDFRTSYVLRYTPRGVAATGWHEILVTVPKRPKLVVRARKGYEGG